MRSTEKRLVAVKQRAKEIQQEQKVRSNWIISLSSIAASLVLVVGMGLAMPGIMSQMNTGEKLSVSGMASIFSSGNGIGYVVIALLAFTLGAFVTILCIHLQRKIKTTTAPDDKGDKKND